MKNRSIKASGMVPASYLFCLVIVGLTISAGNATEPTSESDTERLAKETQNPVANLISVPFQNNFNFGIGPNDATQWVLNVQPVIPITLNKDWNLITRTINPIMCAAIFVQIEAGKSPGAQLGSATKVALAVFVILAVAALVGVKVLHLFGVSLDAFMVAGGGVLAWLGFSMLRGLPPGPPAAASPDANPSLTPLILFAASPGTITGVITIAAAHAKSGIPVTALVAVAVATIVMWLLIVLVARLGARASGGFVHDTATRFLGLIVIAMGVQFALSGMRSFMLEPDHAIQRHGANAAGVTRSVCRTSRGCDTLAEV